MITSEKRADDILYSMRQLEEKYPGCETIQLLGNYLDYHVEDTLEREVEVHDERLAAAEKVVKELDALGVLLLNPKSNPMLDPYCPECGMLESAEIHECKSWGIKYCSKCGSHYLNDQRHCFCRS